MYKAFIEPDLDKAHLRISNTFNPFSGFMDATYILKSAKHVTVQDIQAAVPVGAQPLHRNLAEVKPGCLQAAGKHLLVPCSREGRRAATCCDHCSCSAGASTCTGGIGCWVCCSAAALIISQHM